MFTGLAAIVAVGLDWHAGLAAPKSAAGPKLAHMVYFKLKDGSGGNRAKLVASCKLLLSGHEGVEYFSTGSLAGDLNKEFNDREFDVSLNLVFVDKEAHDKYQESDRHKKFIEENMETIEKVRVFDSYLSPAPASGKQARRRARLSRPFSASAARRCRLAREELPFPRTAGRGSCKGVPARSLLERRPTLACRLRRSAKLEARELSWLVRIFCRFDRAGRALPMPRAFPDAIAWA